MHATRAFGLVLAAALLASAGTASGQTPMGTAFTYQGHMERDGGPVNDRCDFRFILWDAESDGSQVGTTQTAAPDVIDGIFFVVLDFGEDAITGDARWLEIEVQCPGDADFVTLTPRQELTPTPHALFGSSAPWDGLVDVPPDFADGTDDDTLAGLSCINGEIAKWNGAFWQCAGDDTGAGDYWNLTGNAGTTAGPNFVGTTDNQALELKVYSTRALRIEPHPTSPDLIGPNLIGGYSGNSVTAGVVGATIGGGGQYDDTNRVTDHFGTVGGGSNNHAGDNAGNTSDRMSATVSGGIDNSATGKSSTVGGGEGNSASGTSSIVAGGRMNAAGYDYATVGGGETNAASATYATVSGGDTNTASWAWSTVGGGRINIASADYATVAGGSNNEANHLGSTVAGGHDNCACGTTTTVTGGHDNNASGSSATVGGGSHNNASAYLSTVAGGGDNEATASHATVPGGYGNTAGGVNSFAAGLNAKANNDGCFVWGDFCPVEVVTCSNDNRWVARSSGGVYFYTSCDLSTGSYLPAGGNSWNSISDRGTKENFTPVDKQALLEQLANIPVQAYNLKSQDPSIRHIGPVAQDFAAFGYGESKKAINMEDADGVALAAIQGLYEIVKEKEAKIEALRAQNDAQVAELEARLAALENLVKQADAGQQGGDR